MLCGCGVDDDRAKNRNSDLFVIRRCVMASVHVNVRGGVSIKNERECCIWPVLCEG